MIRTGILKGWRLWKLSLVLYIVELVMALFIGLQVMSAIEDGISGSMDIERFMDSFDYSTYHDFLVLHGDVFDLLIFQLKLFIPIFFIVNIFTTAGILYCGKINSSRWRDFWKGGSIHFFGLLVNFILYSFLFLIWSLLWVGPMIWLVPYYLETVGCEACLFSTLIIMIPIYLFGLMYLINASAVSKCQLIEKDISNLYAFGHGLGYSLRRMVKLSGIFLFFFLALMVILTIYNVFVRSLGLTTPTLIILTAIVQQFIIWLRVLFRMMYLYSVQAMHFKKVSNE
ncbi:MAG: hypothetical protein R3275_05890 [Saprospiraceae bacterium]|nr:hypothetical protein [Saprospiraceae bacterium]